MARPSAAPLSWPANTYLSFSSINSDLIGQEGPILKIELRDAVGAGFLYAIDRRETEKSAAAYYLRYVVSGQDSNDPAEGSVSQLPPHACLHFRIEDSMELNWLSGDCGQRSLKDAGVPVQPPSFPLNPSDLAR